MHSNYSVLLTVYQSDVPDYFNLSLRSMLQQTVLSDDIVVVKDGPLPDSLEQILNSFLKEFPERIHPFQLPQNVGLGLALNEGLKICKNDLVARMDADDISLPNRCEEQLKMFEKDPGLDIVGCPVKEFVGMPSSIVGIRTVPLDNESIYRYAKKRDPFNHPAVMYRKSKVLEYGPYKPYRKNQDTALWIDMLSHGCKCANCKESLLLFRFDENTYRKRKSWENTKLLISIRWNAYRRGFCSLFDFLSVAIMQFGVFLLPIAFQKKIYRKVLRN